MKNKLSETELAVDAWLKEKGITYAVSGGTATKRDDWDCDAWIYQMYRKGKVISDSYYTGIGHRKLTEIGKHVIARAGKMSPSYRERLIAENSKAAAPHAAGVLHSLLLDSYSAEQNFHDWCADFGANTDSIKALNTYNACCETLQQVRGFFTNDERAELRTLLEDY